MKLTQRLSLILQEYTKYFRAYTSSPLTGKTLFVTGAQRSGTTWVANMLNVPGIRLYNEPIGPYTSQLWNSSGEVPKGDDLVKDLRARLADIEKGKNHINFEWAGAKFDQRTTNGRLSPVALFGMSYGRVLIKDPLVIENLSLLSKLGNMEFLVMRRHPCGYVSSLKKLNWKADHRVNLLLTDPQFERFEFRENPYVGQGDVSSLSDIDKMTLQYCMFQRILEDFVDSTESATSYIYEDLCADPSGKFEQIFKTYGLPYNDSAREIHEHLTTGGGKFSDNLSKDDDGEIRLVRHYVKRDPQKFAWIWRERLSRAEIDRIRKIFDSFELPIYQDPRMWVLDKGIA